MRLTTAYLRSLRYHWRAGLAVALGALAGSAVLTGALLVGTSMRGSLRAAALDRLGRVEHALHAPRFFRAALATDLAGPDEAATVCPLVMARAGATHAALYATAAPVQVLGVDERFWQLGPPDATSPPMPATGRIVWFNQTLAADLAARVGDDVLLRLARPAAVSPETLLGRRYVAALLGKSAVIVDTRTGREVWSMPWETSWDVNAATPIFHNGHLFFSSGYEHGSAVLKLRPADDSRLAVEKLWSGQAILAKFQTPILHDGHLYTCDQVGLKCVHLATGELKWQQGDRRDKQFQNGTVVLSGDTLIILTERGELVLAPATPAGFAPTARAAILDGLCWTVPTLYRGRIYARNLERLVCLELPR